MYLSRIRLRPDITQNSQLHRVIASNQDGAHRLLWDLFPAPAENERLLFREEIAAEQGSGISGPRGAPVYYLVSRSLPQTDNPLFEVASKPYLPDIREGDRLNFRLRANPVVSRKDEQGRTRRHDVYMDAQHQLLEQLAQQCGLEFDKKASKGARKKHLLSDAAHMLEHELSGRGPLAARLNQALAYAGDQALRAWLDRQGARHGFSLVEDAPLEVSAYRWNPLLRKSRSRKDKAGFSSADFCGALQVTDAPAFVAALHAGIGPAKGFGCGLMMVKRAM